MKKKILQYYYFSISSTIIIFNIIILLNPNEIIKTSKSALLLWFNNIIPSLLPFIILMNLLRYLNGYEILEKIFHPIINLLFNRKSIAGISFVAGILSGYPLGGKIICELYNDKKINKNDAQYFLMFCNNAGPLFIIGTIGITIFKSKNIGYFLLFVHITSAILNGILLRFFLSKSNSSNFKITKSNKYYSISDALNESIRNGMETILLIGGYIIFYSILCSILNVVGIIDFLTINLTKIIPLNYIQVKSLIMGFFEITIGINELSQNQSNLQINLTIISIILAFGGLSIHGQTFLYIAKTDLKKSKYYLGKIFHSALAGVISFTTYNLFKFDVIPVFNNKNIGIDIIYKYSIISNYILVILIIYYSLNMLKEKN